MSTNKLCAAPLHAFLMACTDFAYWAAWLHAESVGIVLQTLVHSSHPWYMTNDCVILPLLGPDLCDKEFLISPHCSSLSPLNLNQFNVSTAVARNHLSHMKVCPQIYLELIRDNLRCLLKQQQSQLDLATRLLFQRNNFFFFLLPDIELKTFISELTKVKPAAAFQATASDKFCLTDLTFSLSSFFFDWEENTHVLQESPTQALPKLRKGLTVLGYPSKSHLLRKPGEVVKPGHREMTFCF